MSKEHDCKRDGHCSDFYEGYECCFCDQNVGWGRVSE